MRNDTPGWQLLLERILPWLILGILAVFTYAKFIVIPYIGFEFSKGEITEIYPPIPDDSLQVGDRLIWIDQVNISKFLGDLNYTLFAHVNTGDTVSLVVERDGQTLNLDWVVPGPDRVQLLQRFNSLWWLPYVFWIAGIATLLFIRPKDARWVLMAVFNFLTAVWLSAGNGPSHWHIWKSGFILTSTIWLCLPIYLHLHWMIPRPLKRLPNYIWGALYLIGIGLAISEWFQVLPRTAFYGGFVLTLILSIAILMAHALFQKEYRRDIAALGLAVVLMLLPPIGAFLVSMGGFDSPGFAGGSFLALPALPGAYFFVAYRRQFQNLERRMKRLTRIYLGVIIAGALTVTLLTLANFRGSLSGSTIATGIIVTMIAAISAITGFSPFLALPALTGETILIKPYGEIEIRANRLLSLYLFSIFVGFILSIGIIISDVLFSFPGETTLTGMVAAILGGVLTVAGFAPFQHFVNRRLLGIQFSQEDILKSYSDRITTGLDYQNLAHLLQDDLLPSLLVRQSALLQIDASGVKPFIMMGVEDTRLPAASDLPDLLKRAGRFLRSTADSPQSWIRLILPLQIGEKTTGLWLLGRRDPDDFYAQSEISTLVILANQTAIALVNIEQARHLHTLYQANIDWHEEERAALARELHDDVLGQLAILSTQTNSTDSPKFQESYQLVAERLRRMVSNLRPASLQYGLFFALDECVDELSSHFHGNASITLDIPATDSRYDPKVEEHIYRIVQQACENAFRHANAANIQVRGTLEPDRIHLMVEDDGIGFETEALDFNALLADKHFGLAGMFERADLIDAEMKFDKVPPKGTRLTICWKTDSASQK